MVKKIKKKILENYKSLNNNVIKSNYFISSSPLPFILINFNKNNIKICDFAGSLESYFQVLILNKKKIEIDIVEVPGVIKLYKRLKKFFKDKKNIK